MFVLPSLGIINYNEALEGGLSYDVVRVLIAQGELPENTHISFY